jgi:hypothetical protein
LGLERVILDEDRMINHDAEVFGDWDRVKRYQVGATVFQKGQERLTVINVNRNKLEKTLGVDLIYYCHTYNSYIMIQYKRLTRENTNDKWGYRPTEVSYKEEIDRMRNFEDLFPRTDAISDIIDYRLHQEPFYFKLCPAEIFDPTSTDMLPGMYIPLDFWKILIESPNVLGKRGGKMLTFENVGRYLNNSFFINLAGQGWIGSKIIRTDVISSVIQESLEHNRAVVLAAMHLAGKTTYDNFTNSELY